MSLANTHFGAEKIKEMLETRQSVFFVGIGGINLSSLAHLTHIGGKCTGGSDRTRTPLTERLEGEGIEIFYEHNASNVENYDMLVYTVAISPDNPEYLRACERGIPCVSRADYMGYIMSDSRVRIGVSGMHGKSSTTSMCAEVLMGANKNPTVLSGAPLASMGGSYRVGGKDFFVFEACEYMDSFLDFLPTLAVVLNVELDHVDYFSDLAHVKRSYLAFANKAEACVANADDANVRDALGEYGKPIIYFGVESEDAEYRAENIQMGKHGYEFDITHNGELVCHVALSVLGYHNIYNALAAAAALDYSGVSAEAIGKGLSSFSGAQRRAEYKGALCDVPIYDDYAHHPTEIATTLRGFKAECRGRLFCVFQSHTYSRTAALFDGFAESLAIADRVIVTDIYSARETDTMGMSPELLANAVSLHGAQACAVHSFEEAAELLKAELVRGDMALVMGAGDVFHTFDYLDLKK